jgi:hypothetical protein
VCIDAPADNASAVAVGLIMVNNVKEPDVSLASQRAQPTGQIARSAFAEKTFHRIDTDQYAIWLQRCAARLANLLESP